MNGATANATTARKCKIFVCHSSEDKEIVVCLTELLQLSFTEVRDDDDTLFVSSLPQHGAGPGHDWSAEIVTAITNCRVFIMVMTERSLKSQYALMELGGASCLGRRIFALRHKSLTTFPVVTVQHTVLGNDDWHATIDRFLKAVQELAKLQPGKSIADGFVKSAAEKLNERVGESSAPEDEAEAELGEPKRTNNQDAPSVAGESKALAGESSAPKNAASKPANGTHSPPEEKKNRVSWLLLGAALAGGIILGLSIGYPLREHLASNQVAQAEPSASPSASAPRQRDVHGAKPEGSSPRPSASDPLPERLPRRKGAGKKPTAPPAPPPSQQSTHGSEVYNGIAPEG